MGIRERNNKGQFLTGPRVPKHLAQAKYYLRYRSILQQKQREKTLRVKKLVYQFYGNKCNCCGEPRGSMLSIDHVNNDGYKDRQNPSRGSSTTRIYEKIIRLGYPSDYQILCMNCNFSKKKNGGFCEHKTEKNG